MPAAENQEQQVTPLGGDAQGLFELILDGVPLLKDSDVKQKLLQWNLNETLQIKRFRVKRRVTSDAAEEIIAQFFQDAHVRTLLSLPLETTPGKHALQLHRLQVNVTSLAFFDRLVDAGVVTSSGSLKRCLDDVFDGATASDLLKEMLVNPESENAQIFCEATEQSEFIFQLLKVLVIGGSMCQSDEFFAPYEAMAKRLYKALVTVKKSASGGVQVTSLVYAVGGGAGDRGIVFPAAIAPKARFSSCFVVLDATKRWLTVWHNEFKPFW